MYEIRTARNEFQTIFNDTSPRRCARPAAKTDNFQRYPLIRRRARPLARTERTVFSLPVPLYTRHS